ncbi:MAG: CDP-alcohol phosphatidyltransferase family protein [Actinomycetota bacterium]
MGSRVDEGGVQVDRKSSAILTVPNLLSFLRILLIPVFVLLLLHHGTELGGLVLVGVVMSTDWVDGYIARRTNSVSELGKLLDPVSDRLAIAALLVVLVVRDAFPLWAALLILVRDASVFLVGVLLLGSRGRRIDVRYIGKVGTFVLMGTVPMIAWGNFGLPIAGSALAVGWIFFPVGIVEYYAATVLYVGDIRRLLRTPA